jgi:diacylglycerol kinase family enzyme
MQVALLHNSSAGSEQHSRGELVSAIERAGHHVVEQFSTVSELQASLPDGGDCDVVAVAGGDGTVGRAARALAGSGLKMAILPLGTANNISHALGIRGSVHHIISKWEGQVECAFDLGRLVTGNTTRTFVEAFGLGVFPELIRKADAQNEPPTIEAALKRDLSLFRSVFRDSEPRMYQIDIDGQDYSGLYLLVQVMNIRFLGPHLQLVAQSDHCDGQLDVVLVGDAERPIMDKLIAATRVQGKPEKELPTYPARRVTIETADTVYHLDGDLRDCSQGKRTAQLRPAEPERENRTRHEVEVLPHALRILVSPQ